MGFSDAAAESYARMTEVSVDGGFEMPDKPERGTTTLQQHIVELGRDDIACPGRIAIGAAAAAIVEGDDAPAAGGERRRQQLEIAAGAGEAGQADDGKARRVARPEVKAAQRQPVAARIAEFLGHRTGLRSARRDADRG